MLNTVKVPKQFEPLFAQAQECVAKYFGDMKRDPTKGSVEIFDQRYILVRAGSMSVDFFDAVRDIYKDKGALAAANIAKQLLYDVAYAIGRSDARNFHSRMGLTDPIAKLSAGPVHFAYAGWAFVDIFPESRPTPDENYYLIYDHPFSFESDAWEKTGRKTHFSVCVMNAGYSAGWCTESFGVPLVAAEVMCKAKGDEVCRFIMAHHAHIEERVNAYVEKEAAAGHRIRHYEVPGFFERKRLEEAAEASEKRYTQIFEYSNDAIFVADLVTRRLTDCNRRAETMTGYTKDEILSMRADELHPDDKKAETMEGFRKQAEGIVRVVESELLTKDRRRIPVSINAAIIDIEGKPRLMGVFRDVSESKRLETELKKKLTDLEKFNKFAVGRELRMMELKNRVKELEEKLGER